MLINMTAIPEPQHDTIAKINQWHEENQDPPRLHLGGSELGKPCDRALWLKFRWAVIEKFDGRMMRLFRRGHNEEPWFVKDLRAIGVQIANTEENQVRLNFGAHIGGSLDGVITGGLPEAPKTEHVAEFKTHSKKSFDKLCKEGVQKAKPEHFVQMQVYMHGRGCDRAFYLAVCKDDDRLYSERVKYDREVAEKYIARGKNITLSERIPDPISTDPSWYQCKFCVAHSMCHGGQPTQEVNCRTCAHVTALEDGTWHCARHNAGGIPYEFQLKGCECHVLHPDLVPWEMGESGSENEAVYIINGKPIRNGEPGDPHVYTSKELVTNPRAAGAELVEAVKEAFPGAEVTG